ncbi:hypothetical protein [Leifsonia sp. 22587]|uniref:hypothetical protein n=1 Tax=Leifsonia sp. 22587 TaxID=3453946 RepID=UPI003F876731
MSGLAVDKRAFEEQFGEADTALRLLLAQLVAADDLDGGQVVFRDALATVLAVTRQARIWVRDGGPDLGRPLAPAMRTGAALVQQEVVRQLVDAVMQRNDPAFQGLHLLDGFDGERQSPDGLPGV